MTSATDNRTIELLKDYAFALRRLEYAADKPGSNMTLGEYEAEEKRVTDEYAQAIAATVGNGTCTMRLLWCDYEDGECYECSNCKRTTYTHGREPSYCERCGAKVVKR